VHKSLGEEALKFAGDFGGAEEESEESDDSI
jgi:hypothetical protein